MTDMELRKLAARAAGFPFTMTDDRGWFRVRAHPSCEWELWDPLTDDGEAFRLSVKLGVRTAVMCDRAYAFTGLQEVSEPEGDDQCAAMRRAIVRAAAQIGNAKPADAGGNTHGKEGA